MQCQDGRIFFRKAKREGRQVWRASFNAYAGDFAHSHVCTETVKGRMGAVGMWKQIFIPPTDCSTTPPTKGS